MGRGGLFDPPVRGKRGRENGLLWLFEPLEADAGYGRRRMFGCEAAYLDGLLCLALSDREPPWDGLLVCTDWARHEALQAEFAALRVHPELGKWLYLPQDDPAFEAQAAALVRAALARDARIGVAPQPRKLKR